MPTFSVIALDRILEPTTNNNNNGNKNGGAPNNNGNKNGGAPAKPSVEKRKAAQRAVISPVLYTTPETTPVPDYPTSFNLSPYVVDHKRRAPCVVKGTPTRFQPGTKEGRKEKNEGNGMARNCLADSGGGEFVENTIEGGENLSSEGGERMMNGEGKCGCEGFDLEAVGATGFFDAAAKEERESDCDEFLDADESRSLASSSDFESRSRRSLNYSSHGGQSEYYDAIDDIFPEDGSQISESFNSMMQSELDRLKCNLSMETERRKMVEEALTHMQNRWQEMAKKFSSVGLQFPSITNDSAHQDVEEDAIDDICRRMIVGRFVAGAVGRGSARAEVEQETETIIEGKNREIARLRDKLQYYEMVNHEMSQRNQEAIEIARRRRRTQKKRQRWLWGSLAAAVTIGTSALFYSYLTRTDMGFSKVPLATDTNTHGSASENVEI